MSNNHAKTINNKLSVSKTFADSFQVHLFINLKVPIDSVPWQEKI